VLASGNEETTPQRVPFCFRSLDFHQISLKFYGLCLGALPAIGFIFHHELGPDGHPIPHPTFLFSRKASHCSNHRSSHPSPTMARVCAECSRNLLQTSYTANQWSKGQGYSRCAGCVHGHYSDNAFALQSNSGRYNDSERATFTNVALFNPFASGTFRWVAKGHYVGGPRDRQACVIKWFKTGGVFEDDYFALDIRAIDKALDIVNRFNQFNVVDKEVKVNVATVWTFDDDDAHPDFAGQKALSEPFIQNYQKFNSNTGWNDDRRAWGRAMQALSRKSTMTLHWRLLEHIDAASHG
jgi:hypothetical protein